MSKKIKNREGLSKKSKKPRAAEKPVTNQAFLQKIFSDDEPSKKVPESSDGSRKGGRSLEVSPPGRKCVCCGAALSVYNNGKLCWPCDKVIEEWKNFSRRRSEIEREMSPSCLKYVEENFPEGKRKRDALGGEVSSGSWARVMGKNMSRKKEE